MPRRIIKKEFDLIVLGGGAAGISAADAANQKGERVCLIEKEALGGDCPRWACVPVKALLKSAKVYELCRRSAEFGVVADNVRFNFRNIMARKDAIVAAVTGNDRRLLRWAEEEGIVVLRGEARFLDASTVVVGDAKLSATRFIVATGSTEVVPPIAGLDDVGYWTYRDVMALKKQPKSLLIVGGGPVGCELATFFGTLESRVLLCEAGKRILPRDDGELAALASAALRGRGVEVHESTKVLSVRRQGKQVVVTYQRGSARRMQVKVDAVLLAAGRRPNIDGLGLESAGIKVDTRGLPKLDAHGRSSVKHIAFAGDARGQLQFTHVAHQQGWDLGASTKHPYHGVVPHVTFVDPELAGVGLTEEQALAEGRKIHVARFPIGALSRAVIDGERDGMLKIVVDEKNGDILGGHMLGERAGEVIHEVALAMHAGVPFDHLVGMMHAFPTYAEAIAGAR